MERTDPVDSIDKRHFSRIPFDAQVEIQILEPKPFSLAGKLQDISLKGLLFEVDDNVLLQFNQDNLIAAEGEATIMLSNSPIELSAKVKAAHVQKNTIGFSIEQMPVETIEHLKKLILLNLGSEDLLNRELHQFFV